MGQAMVFPIVIAALALGTGALAVALYQILRQQGRMLMRLDYLEQHLGLAADEAVARGTAALQAREPAGLPVGTAFPDFTLRDLAGAELPLSGLRGQRVLLINWNSRCGFCDLIAPELARLQPELERAGVQMVLVSSGPADAERECAEEHGLEMPILLREGEGLAAFAGVGTPAAYLLDEQGRVAEPLAVGAEEVPALAAGLAAAPPKKERRRRPGERPLSESRIVRDGLKAGTPAPAFTLPEVRGGEVSLDAYRGRKVLMVFSDPHCGPCDRLAPHLLRLHREHRNNGLDLLLIGRGDPGENRRKAEQHGYEFPVLLQRTWEVSRRYGIFATPVGFLIDEQGVITRDVASGIDEILALAPAAPTAGEGGLPS